MCGNFHDRELSRVRPARQPDRGELLGAADARALPSARAASRRSRRRDGAQRQRAALAQPPRALLDDVAGEPAACARPACRAAAKTETRAVASARIRRPDRASANIASVSVGKPAIISAPNTTSGRRRRTFGAERDRVGARVPPLHALEDEIVAGLQRQMQMRHQPLVIGERIEQIVVGLDRIRSTTAAAA